MQRSTYAVSALLALVGAAGLGIVYAMLPSLYVEYAAVPGAGWTVTAYLLVSAATAAFCGRLGDLAGRRYMSISCGAPCPLVFVRVWVACRLHLMPKANASR